MNPIRTLIVDDEPLARSGVQELLARDPDFAVIAQAADGRSALAVLQEQHLDVMFLDVQMPGLSGVELLEQIPPARRPIVIFITAFDQHAIKAFDLLAIDYLVKPFTNRRFAVATARVKALMRSRTAATVEDQFDRLLRHFRGPARMDSREGDSGLPQRMVVKADGDLHFLDHSRIIWIEGQGDYLKVHCENGSVLTRDTMAGLERRLDPARFMRIHKSATVNLTHVRKLKSVKYGDHELVMSNGASIRIGRSYRDKVAKLVE
jgi:two-component system LytT family response regulator